MINATEYSDLETVACGVLLAERAGQSFLRSDRLWVCGTSWPDGVSLDAAALLKTCPEQRFKEVLMVRTVVRLIEPGTYAMQMFQARRVIDRPSL